MKNGTKIGIVLTILLLVLAGILALAVALPRTSQNVFVFPDGTSGGSKVYDYNPELGLITLDLAPQSVLQTIVSSSSYSPLQPATITVSAEGIDPTKAKSISFTILDPSGSTLYTTSRSVSAKSGTVSAPFSFTAPTKAGTYKVFYKVLSSSNVVLKTESKTFSVTGTTVSKPTTQVSSITKATSIKQATAVPTVTPFEQLEAYKGTFANCPKKACITEYRLPENSDMEELAGSVARVSLEACEIPDGLTSSGSCTYKKVYTEDYNKIIIYCKEGYVLATDNTKWSGTVLSSPKGCARLSPTPSAIPAIQKPIVVKETDSIDLIDCTGKTGVTNWWGALTSKTGICNILTYFGYTDPSTIVEATVSQPQAKAAYADLLDDDTLGEETQGVCVPANYCDDVSHDYPVLNAKLIIHECMTIKADCTDTIKTDIVTNCFDGYLYPGTTGSVGPYDRINPKVCVKVAGAKQAGKQTAEESPVKETTTPSAPSATTIGGTGAGVGGVPAVPKLDCQFYEEQVGNKCKFNQDYYIYIGIIAVVLVMFFMMMFMMMVNPPRRGGGAPSAGGGGGSGLDVMWQNVGMTGRVRGGRK